MKNETVVRTGGGRFPNRRKTKHRRHCSTCKERWGSWTMVCPRCGKRTLTQKTLIAAGLSLLAIIFAKTLGLF
jgi:predicted amidophosphoribosyltransferase